MQYIQEKEKIEKEKDKQHVFMSSKLKRMIRKLKGGVFASFSKVN